MRNSRLTLVIGSVALLAVPIGAASAAFDMGANGRHGHRTATPTTPAGERVDESVENTVATARVEPLTAAEQELLAWAEHRFSLVGLDLPEMEVTFHDSRESCGWHPGRFQASSEHRHVEVCVPDSGTFHSHQQRQRTLVHELAHAWDHANLDASERRELLAIVDATDWYASDSDWEERGVERFAETIVWGLYDQRRRPTLIDVSCAELHADFISITGSDALGPLEPVCEVTDATN